MWKDKPALYAALVMIGGFLAANSTPVPPLGWGAGALIALALTLRDLIASRGLDPRAACSSVSGTALLLCASSLWYHAAVHYDTDHITRYLHLQHPIRVYCRVADEPRVRDGRTNVLVNVSALASEDDSAAVEGNALLTVLPGRADGETPVDLVYGDLLAFDAIPEEPPDTRNPGEVSYRDHLAINNIHALLRVAGPGRIARYGERRPDWFFEHIIFPSRHFVTRIVHLTLRGEEAKYLTGLLLGDRTDLSKEIQTAFANTGTTHVLAVSGSHVVVIVVAVYALFGLLRIPRRVKIAATIGAILYYMFLTGATPSVVRASFMASVVLSGKLVQRRSSVYNSLGVSAILMFLYDPKQLFDIGFQLSFAAVLSMVYFYPKFTGWTRSIPRAWKSRWTIQTAAELCSVSAAAQIGTIPFTAVYFERVSLISFIVNLYVVPLAGINISLGFVGTLVSIVSLWAGSCINEVNAVLSRWVLASVTTANEVPYAIVHTASFGAMETAFYVCTVALLVNLARPVLVRRLLLVFFFLADCLVVGSALASNARVLRVTFYDVGQGDAALVEFPGGATLLVDAGPRTESPAADGRAAAGSSRGAPGDSRVSGDTGSAAAYDAGDRIVVPSLRRKGIGRPTAVMVTHPHDDHMGGVRFLLRELGADRVVESPQRSVSASYASYAGALSGLSARHVFAGDTLVLDPQSRVYILHPGTTDIHNDSIDGFSALNNSSIVTKITYGAVSFLLMGDAERSAEEDLAGRYGDLLRSDVLKIGHHGSASGSTDAFLDVVAPREAVISVGRFNKFHHPSRRVVERLLGRGIAVHRTDREGAVVYETDGRSLVRVDWR